MAKVMDPNAWACESLGASIDFGSMIFPFALIGFAFALWAWRFGRDAGTSKVSWIVGLCINGLALGALAIAR